jgi:hypothetical protein
MEELNADVHVFMLSKGVANGHGPHRLERRSNIAVGEDMETFNTVLYNPTAINVVLYYFILFSNRRISQAPPLLIICIRK